MLLLSCSASESIYRKYDFGDVMLTSRDFCIDSSKTVLAFEDDFEDGRIDPSKWVVKEGPIRDKDFIMMKQWYQKENVYEADGALHIITSRYQVPQGKTFVYNWRTGEKRFSTFDIASGEIWGRQTNFGYGIYEMEATLPAGQGLWLAFWLFDDKPWEELDFFEIFGSDDLTKDSIPKFTYTSNIHNIYNFPNAVKKITAYQSYENEPGEFKLDFTKPHVYKVEYTPISLKWYIDDNLVREFYRFYYLDDGEVTPYEDCKDVPLNDELMEAEAFPVGNRQQYYLILNTNVTNDGFKKFPGPTEETKLPADYRIEWIKYTRMRPEK